MALLRPKCAPTGGLLNRAVLFTLLGSGLSSCFPLERATSDANKTVSEPSTLTSNLDKHRLNGQKDFIIKYSSDLETCQAESRATPKFETHEDIDSIRRALADAPTSATIVVSHRNSIKNDHVKNCLVRLGYVVSQKNVCDQADDHC